MESSKLSAASPLAAAPSTQTSCLIDTHCHLHDHEFYSASQAEQALAHARENGVMQLICIGTNHADSLAARDFALAHPDVFWTYGVHPSSLVSAPAGDRALTKDFTGSHPVAIGEIGLDYHYEPFDRAARIRLFEQMLQLARSQKLPVSLHIREAFADAFGILDNFPEITGVVHSFTGSKKELKKALDRGFYIGVNGLATYTTPPLPPLERMLLETDAPFLTPVPNRGTMNMPGYVRDIAHYLSEHLGVAESTLAEQTTKNAKFLFHL